MTLNSKTKHMPNLSHSNKSTFLYLFIIGYIWIFLLPNTVAGSQIQAMSIFLYSNQSQPILSLTTLK